MDITCMRVYYYPRLLQFSVCEISLVREILELCSLDFLYLIIVFDYGDHESKKMKGSFILLGCS